MEMFIHDLAHYHNKINIIILISAFILKINNL